MGRNFKISFWEGYMRSNVTRNLPIDSAICSKQEENHRESSSNWPSRRAFKIRKCCFQVREPEGQAPRVPLLYPLKRTNVFIHIFLSCLSHE